MSPPANPEQPAYMNPLPFRRAGYVYRLLFFSQRHRNNRPKSFDFSAISNYRNMVSPGSPVGSSKSHMLMDFDALSAQGQAQPNFALISPQDQTETTLASSHQSVSPLTHHETSAIISPAETEYSPFYYVVYSPIFTSRSPSWYSSPSTGLWQSPGGQYFVVEHRDEDWEPDSKSGRLELGMRSYAEHIVESEYSELVEDLLLVIGGLAFLVIFSGYVILVFVMLKQSVTA
ncbi:hypothetical protein NW762_010030 [Fusarium torreyae]|uniref:Uncharacterized protein n=1 Tax=Fusarium torreyae TaxID=1237075 RepID=A0A9W8VB79_9HYPO|nr:hypothetical protein NW762_010030 [Fusarium torreyae]